MAFCPNCGKEMAGDARFCPSCGASVNQVPAAGPAPVMTVTPGTQSGLQQNVAAMLCYVVGWVTGIIFLVIEKDRFIRFHAMQSIVVFGVIEVAQLLLSFLFVSILWRVWFAINGLFWLAEFGLWVWLMLKAYNRELYKLPFAGDLAEKLLGMLNM
jgi:uncharacterized membrane protein